MKGKVTRWWILLMGDVAVFHLQVALGFRSHGLPFQPGRIAEVALPFWSSWILLAWILGWARTPDTPPGRVARTWWVAWPLSLFLRMLLLHRPVPLSFALVVLITLTVFLTAWRWMARKYLL